MFQKTYRFRLLLLAFCTFAVFGTIEARLYYIQVTRHTGYALRAQDQQNRTVHLQPRRGDMLDRNGQTLATSYITDTIVLDTRKLKNPSDELIADLAVALRRSSARVQSYFDRPGYHYVYRKAPREISEAVEMIEDRHENLPDNLVVFEQHSKRIYPNDSLGSHLLGYTKIDDTGDNIGLSGLELAYDEYLKGEYKTVEVPVRSMGGRLAPYDEEAIEATYGNTLILTLDKQIQMFAERELRRQVNNMEAKAGVAVVLDVKTGAVLALANCPDFDPNYFARYAQQSAAMMRNRALIDPIEIGSVMKIITTTLLLDQGLLSLGEMIDCHQGYIQMDGRVIRDTHDLGVVPFQAFAESSNVAMAVLSKRFEPSAYYEGLVRFGLGQPTGIDMPYEESGILRSVSDWTAQSRTSLAIGYETSLTAIQVASAVAAVGNGGWRMRPYLVDEVRTHRGAVIRSTRPEILARVAGAAACESVLGLMEDVVIHEDGTGTEARLAGYRLGGKTGTTRKHQLKNGKPQYYASFAALVPLSDPRLAIYVYVDEPQRRRYGGQVAAPVVREIARAALHQLNIPPDDPASWERDRLSPPPPERIATQQAEDPPAPLFDLPHKRAGARPALPGEMSPAEVPVGHGPAMPDLSGQTMREAWVALSDRGIEAKMLGSGIAVHQEPAPGKRLAAHRPAMVIFAHPSEAARTRRARQSDATP